MGRVYLDWNATAPLRQEVRAAMLAALDVAGNPSSVHAEGRAARALVERARGEVAALVGCKPSEVVFTSGATEAAGILAHVPPHGAVCVDETAHDALWAHLDLTHAEGGANVLAKGLANSETGVITEPPARDEDGAYPYGAIRCGSLFLDVTQAAGRIPWSFHWSGADMACVSAHKIGGPKGVGALIVREGLDIGAVQKGGGQELGRRSGTENVAGIAGFGAAATAALRDMDAGVWAGVEKLRNILESSLASGAKGTIFVGNDRPRLPNTSCFVTPGWKGETQVMQMDLAGFAVSSGSACSSGKVKTPRVLAAMGLDQAAAESALRVSLGPETTEEDVLRFAETWLRHEKKFRQRAA
ncbi:aminotransferase class V-fold PLP-dependent enzyme [Alphaproteobacteria bacterium GH1-50]|uniref:Cysteine desulfurase n=1 Tax=Kangsaoukella pontilimi TaxID=2691042 RepID=A0A7C9MQP7_9RHOB|nr:aminotransferase class V-fold PLP-dependent enzyme [Kangsaoukella pontilimi]MXQ07597.1 aminotransferase class V-fold PLP-dependent enzyme [Kangsaoukella pontilimi]